MKSADYWEKRALDRESQANKVADEVLHTKIYGSYDRAAAQITKNVNKIFNRYMVDGKLSEQEAKALLSITESEDILGQFKKELSTITDPDIKRKALNRLHAQAYAARITRLEAVRERIYTEMAKVSDNQISRTRSLLGKTVEETYYRSIFDTQQGTGLAFDFAELPQKSIDAIVNEDWSGAHFSKRVWGNTQLLADEAYKTLSSGLMSGMGIHRMATQLDDVMVTGKYAATRLVRSETSRAYNDAEKLSYEESEIDKYRYLATLDGVTCEECGALDSKIFPVKDAKTGLNYPPIHANDRCTTVANFGDETLDKLQRRARDPETGETKVLSDDISYEEWAKDNVPADNAQLQQDKKQHKRYIQRLGKLVPKDLKEFRQLKKAGGNEWGILQAQYKGMGYYARAVVNEPEITKVVLDTANIADMEPAGLAYKIKGKDSYLRKIASNYKPDGTEYEVKDILRYTLTSDVDNLAEKTNRSIDVFANKGYNTTEVKNSWLNFNNPYKGINTSLTAPNGQKFEMQYHTPESFALKNGKLHELYEKARVIQDKKSPEYLALQDEMFNLSDKLAVPKRIKEVKNK